MDFTNDRQNDLLDKLGCIFIENSEDIPALINSTFDQIASYYNIERGLIKIYFKYEDDVTIDVKHGYKEDGILKEIYQAADGITATVHKTGYPYVVLDALNEPGLINRSAVNRYAVANKVSFICVPIKLRSMVIGTITVDIINNFGRELDEELRILKTVSIMIAQAVNGKIEYIIKEKRLKDENRLLKNKLDIWNIRSEPVGTSSAMKSVYDGILTASACDCDVLITGKAGTGKKTVAEQIFRKSGRAEKPFVRFNAGTCSPSSIEDLLFGCIASDLNDERGLSKGIFELADGGTVLLEGILSFNNSVRERLKLLLQTGTIRKNGTADKVTVNTRVIIVSDENYSDNAGEMFWCDDIMRIYIPELRERKSDILLLANCFIEKYSHRMEKYIKRMSSAAVELLMAYNWPGNVKELENCIEMAVDSCEEGIIRGYHFPPQLQAVGDGESEGTLEEKTDIFEREIITDALKVSGGNITVAAKKLGSTKRILGYKIDKLSIDYKTFRNNEK